MICLVFVVVAPACVTWTELEDVSCPDEGTELTYANFASDFFGVHCNSCHGVNSADRKGAPLSFIFDTHDQVRAVGERIFLRSAGDNATMPPGPDDPALEERDKLAEWIACGMP